MRAERLGVHSVDRRELRDVGDEHGRLRDVGHRRAAVGEDRPDVGERLARLALAPSTIAPLSGIEADLAREHQPVAGADRGRVGTGHRRCARRGNGLDGHRYLLSRRAAGLTRGERIGPRALGTSEGVPSRGCDRGEHRVGRAGERRARVVDHGDVDRRHVLGAHDAERADREIVHLAVAGSTVSDSVHTHPSAMCAAPIA